jgi:hypothetical protein
VVNATYWLGRLGSKGHPDLTALVLEARAAKLTHLKIKRVSANKVSL